MPIETLGFEHIDLTVNDFARSQPFYEKVLSELGFQRAPDLPAKRRTDSKVGGIR